MSKKRVCDLTIVGDFTGEVVMVSFARGVCASVSAYQLWSPRFFGTTPSPSLICIKFLLNQVFDGEAPGESMKAPSTYENIGLSGLQQKPVFDQTHPRRKPTVLES